MIRYLTLIRFTEQGARNLKKSTQRAAAFRAAAARSGVRVEAQYWTTGTYDGVLVISAAEEGPALQCLAALSAAGNVRTETLRAFEEDEFKMLMGKNPG